MPRSCSVTSASARGTRSSRSIRAAASGRKGRAGRRRRERHCSSARFCRAPSPRKASGSFRFGRRSPCAPGCGNAAWRRRCSGPTTYCWAIARSRGVLCQSTVTGRDRARRVRRRDQRAIAGQTRQRIAPPPAFCDDVAPWSIAGGCCEAILLEYRARFAATSIEPQKRAMPRGSGRGSSPGPPLSHCSPTDRPSPSMQIAQGLAPGGGLRVLRDGGSRTTSLPCRRPRTSLGGYVPARPVRRRSQISQKCGILLSVSKIEFE